MHVVPLAASDAFEPYPQDRLRQLLAQRHGIDFPYFLFSGRWEPRKNIVRLLQAFSRFKQVCPSEYKLVLTGAKYWELQDAEEAILSGGISSDILDLGKTPFEQLPALYAGARALVFPSLWESFGLPIVEAMRCGTPVLTSDIAAMPEVAGDAAVLVDPYSVESIAAAMRRLAEDDALVARLSANALTRSKSFSWEQSAKLTHQAYEQAHRGNRKRTGRALY